MHKPIGAEEKPWGWNQNLWEYTEQFADGYHVVCRGAKAHIVRGGYSSIHYHAEQANAFQVLDGLLLVFEYEFAGDEVVEAGYSLLGPGDGCIVRAGRLHKFLARRETELLEVYTAIKGGDALPRDIVRFSTNGVDPGLLARWE